MDEDFDNLDNISELKLLESLDLGHRKVKLEDKKEENDKFINDINLLLSKMNEQIVSIKKIPKIQIQSFNIDNIDSNNSNSSRLNKESSNQKINPYSKKPSSRNLNNQSNSKNNFNNGMINSNNNKDFEGNTPNPGDSNNKKNTYKIPDSLNEKTNNKIVNNNLFNNNENKEETPHGVYKLGSVIDENPISNNKNINENNNNNGDIISDIIISENENNNINNNTYNDNVNNDNEKGGDDVQIELKEGDEIIDEIPEIGDNDNNEINNNKNNDINKDKNISSNKIIIQSKNYISEKDEKEENQDNIIESFSMNDIVDNNEEAEILKKNNNNNGQINLNSNKEKDIKEDEEKKNIVEKKEKSKEDEKEIEDDNIDVEYNNIDKNFDIDKLKSVATNIPVPKNNPSPLESINENNNSKEDNQSNNIEIEKELSKEKISQNVEIENQKEKDAHNNRNESASKKLEEQIKESEDIVSIVSEKKDDPEEDNIKEKNEIKSHKNENNVPPQENEINENDKDNNNSKINKINNNISNEDKIEEIIMSTNNKTNLGKRNYTMPQKTLEHDVKNMRKSFTQKEDILIKIKSNYTKTENDESFPDISNIEEYPTLKNLTINEQTFSEIVPEYKENILDNESKEDIQKRVSDLIKKRTTLNFDLPDYSDYFDNLGEQHPNLMEKNFSEDGLKSILNCDEDFEKKVFNNKIFDMINTPVGQIENYESFVIKYNFNKIENKNELQFIGWRKILPDGNSFYRIIMLGLIENYIIKNEKRNLEILLYEILSREYIILYEEKSIDVELCISIFAYILNLLEENNIEKAHEIFIKAYALKDGSFDKLLIIYLRHTLAIYTENVKEFIPYDKRELFNNNNIMNTYMIESLDFEPSIQNIYCMIYLFNININLSFVQGEMSNPNIFQRNLNGDEDVDNTDINIGYFYSSYYILYTNELQNKINYELPISKTTNKFLTFVLKEIKSCEQCKKDTEHILFIEKKYIVCKDCLESYLRKLFNFRADSLKKDGFLVIEYYTRPINLEGSYYIDDYEIIELLENTNILGILLQKYGVRRCDYCEKEDDKIHELKCGCFFCEDCLKEKTLELTKGLKALNAYEKKQLHNTTCECGKKFDIEEGLKIIPKNSKDKNDALERLKNYVNTLCLICTKELRKKDDQEDENYNDINEEVKYKMVKMRKNNQYEGEAKEIYEGNHYICLDCYNKYLKEKIELSEDDEDDEEDNKNDFVDFENDNIECSICCRRHPFRITRNENCCADGCIIY